MAKKYKSRTSHRRRCKKGGAIPPLAFGKYPDVDGGGSWTTSAPPGTTAAAGIAHKSFLSNYASGTPAQNAAALNKFALTGQGQSGGGRSKRRGHGRRRRHSAKSSKKIFPKSFGTESSSREQEMAQGLTQGQAQAQAAALQQAQSQKQAQTQSGGMFASFGALLKEALVPLGLLAAQQTYARGYGKRTRKHRR
jgi:flagellar motor protein MotB